MRRLLFLGLIAGLAFACDSPDRASDRGAGGDAEENSAVEPANPDDDASIHSDTTTSGGMNRQNPYDTVQ